MKVCYGSQNLWYAGKSRHDKVWAVAAIFLAVPQGPSGLGSVFPPFSFSCKEAQRGLAICFFLFSVNTEIDLFRG